MTHSVYIQITTKCNMSCGHCIFNCYSHGHDMSLEIFEKALRCTGQHMTIGGGEPTVHPEFWEMLALTIAKRRKHSWLSCIGVVTNGKKTQDAKKLLGLAKDGKIYCRLAIDQYHEPIDPETITLFLDAQREYNDVSVVEHIEDQNLISSGRCNWGREYCNENTMLIKSDGQIFQCICSDSPCIGDVHGFSESLSMSGCHAMTNDKKMYRLEESLKKLVE
ncbi:hypothetical protein LCGC14_1130310 [marine sediment metagenome]|uniref:Radical SAM core domain-containing protein n=1 Tax=marine sediment metagenome TaxID=412755 RepID=A0A0F9M188_9ZZZZ